MWSRWGFVLLQKQCLLWFWVTWSTLFSSLFSQHWHWPRALCADPPAAFKGQQSTAWLHSLHEAIPGSHGISGISQASHILLERLLITRHSLSVIITQILKKKKLKESEGGKKEKKIKDNGFPGFSSYMETLSTACQIHITGPILSTLLPWHIYLERWWKYGGWRVFEPLRRKRKICLRPSKADNSVTAVEELLCQKRQEQCWTLSNLPLQLSNREECGRGRTGGQWGD